MSLLAEEPSNGYGLIKAISERTGGTWRPSPGSVYPTLQQLVEEGLIEQSGEGRSISFDLTETGRADVDSRADELEKTWAATPDASSPNAAVWNSFGQLAQVVNQFKHAGSDEQRTAASQKLDETRKALYLILAE